MELNRKTLINIREASNKYKDRVLNKDWRRALSELAKAADHVDAMLARAEVEQDEQSK